MVESIAGVLHRDHIESELLANALAEPLGVKDVLRIGVEIDHDLVRVSSASFGGVKKAGDSKLLQRLLLLSELLSQYTLVFWVFGHFIVEFNLIPILIALVLIPLNLNRFLIKKVKYIWPLFWGIFLVSSLFTGGV